MEEIRGSKRAVLVLAAVAAFGIGNYLSSLIPFLYDHRIRFQLVIPILSGYMAGPAAGFLVGFVGNLLGDWLVGEGVLRYAASFSVCNGIYGLLMGLYGGKKRRFDNPEDISGYYAFMLLVVAAGTIYAALVEWFVFGVDIVKEFERLCISIIVSNYLSSAPLIPCFLYFTGKIKRTIVQKFMLFLYYFAFVLAVGSVMLTMSLLSSRFDLIVPDIAANIITYNALIVPIAVTVVAGLLASAAVTGRIVKPISELSGEIRRISDGGFTDRIKVTFGDDLRELSESYNEMTDRIAAYSSEIRRIAAEEERIRTELNVASKIQKMLLPGDQDGEFGGCRIFGRMTSMKEVGGDFFNYFLPDGKRIFFVVADVTGHGIPAALFMMSVESTLSYIVSTESDLERAFGMLNARLCERNSEGYFVTAFAGIFDSSDGRLRYVNAGHPPPLVRTQNGGFHILPCEVNLVLGAFEGVEFKSSETFMQHGDVLCIYSDGVTETMNANFEQYSTGRLIAALDDVSADDPKELVGNIFTNVAEFAGDAEQSDDITVLCVRFCGNPQLTP